MKKVGGKKKAGRKFFVYQQVRVFEPLEKLRGGGGILNK